jgi:glycosyltransferase involved in cell wall biosynthesis
MNKDIVFVYFTYNEEKRIEFCLRNCHNHGEILILDDGSTDATREIAEKYGAKFLRRPKGGIAVETQEMLNFIYSQSDAKWIFWNFADNFIPASLMDKLHAIVHEDKYDYIEIPLYTYLYGETRYVMQKGYSPRFFKRGSVSFDKNYIHGMGRYIGDQARKARLSDTEKFALIHYSSYTIVKYLSTHIGYANQEAQQKNSEGKKFNFFVMVGAMLRYFYIYFKDGWICGMRGFLVSTMYAFFRFITYCRLFEIEHGISLESIEENYNQEREKALQKFKA